MWDPDTAWVGNEDGVAPMFNSNLRDSLDFSMMTSEKEQMNEVLYMPAECDFKMRSTWFDCEDNEHTVKTLDELIGIYEMSVGRGANMLLNIGPDCHGQLPAIDKARILELGEEIRRRYGTPIAEFGDIAEENGAWSVQTKDFLSENSPSKSISSILKNNVKSLIGSTISLTFSPRSSTLTLAIGVS